MKQIELQIKIELKFIDVYLLIAYILLKKKFSKVMNTHNHLPITLIFFMYNLLLTRSTHLYTSHSVNDLLDFNF